MSKTHYWLGALLAFQLILAAVIFWAGGPSLGDSSQEPLFGFQAETIDKIVLSDSEHSITLAKQDGRWQLPELEQLPAQSGKIDDLLTNLASFAPNWPVATTAESLKRFEVADDTFQRRIQLYSGETLTDEALLGTSPGFRKSHIRKKGDEAIYTIALNSFELPVKSQDWLDKSLLRASEIQRIEGADFAIEKAEALWRFASIEDALSGELDQNKAHQWATALETLQIDGIAEKAPEQEGKTLKVKDKTGEWTYRFVNEGNDYYVSRNDRKTVFTIGKFDYDRIASIDSAQLVKEKPQADQETREEEPKTDDQ